MMARIGVKGAFTSPLLWLGVCIVAAHGLYLFGVLDPNPILTDSGIGQWSGGQFVVGHLTIDPNAGVTSQALTHRAMLDWIHGQVPWWNRFEGVGAPLAGDMQSAAFFPFALFLLASNGQVLMYLTLSLIAGYSTYFLLRRLSIAPWIAAAAGVCFGLNGTFAWFRFAPANPICFLPLLLLGLEIARARSCEGRRTHWWLIAVALGLSVVAGFPETAYLDGLLAIVWTVARSVGLRRAQLRAFLTAAEAGAITGLLLSAPLLAAIVGYLPHAFLAQNGDTSGSGSPVATLVQLLLPYGYGPIRGTPPRYGSVIPVLWDNAGGYLTVALVLLGLIGLANRRHRALKVGLVLWVAVITAVAYHVPVVSGVVYAIPGVRNVVVPRFYFASIEMAVVALAAFGLQNLADGEVRRRYLVAAALPVTLACVAAARYAYDVVFQLHGFVKYTFVSTVWGAATIVVIVAAGMCLRGRREAGHPARGWRSPARIALAALIVMLPFEAVVMFILPELSAPRSGTIDTSFVAVLRRHLGDDRFDTLFPLQASYGSYFGTASINVNDLPIPADYAQLFTHDLDPNSNPSVFIGDYPANPNGISPARALVKYRRNYRQLGVSYIVLPGTASQRARTADLKALAPLHLTAVWADEAASIYRLPHAAPFFHTTTRGCAVRTLSWSTVRVRCTHPSHLIRNELAMPGWSAHVNGAPARISQTRLYQQTLALPAGTSTVSFSYQPPLAPEGWIAAIIGAVLALASGLLPRRWWPPAIRSAAQLRRENPDDTVYAS